MEDVFETEVRINMVLELMLGGELFDYVVDKGTLSEKEASVMVRKVMRLIVVSLQNQSGGWSSGVGTGSASAWSKVIRRGNSSALSWGCTLSCT